MILVTGATGNVGRELVKLLLDRGEEVGAVTRDPGSAAVPAGARVVGGDPSRPKTLTLVLRDVEAVLLSPRAVGHDAAGLLALAGEDGARRGCPAVGSDRGVPRWEARRPRLRRRPRTSLKGAAGSGPSCGVPISPPTPWPGRAASVSPARGLSAAATSRSTSA